MLKLFTWLGSHSLTFEAPHLGYLGNIIKPKEDTVGFHATNYSCLGLENVCTHPKVVDVFNSSLSHVLRSEKGALYKVVYYLFCFFNGYHSKHL